MPAARRRRPLPSRTSTVLTLLAGLCVAGGSVVALVSDRDALVAAAGPDAEVPLVLAASLSAGLCLGALLLALRSGAGWRPAVSVRAAFTTVTLAAVVHVLLLQPYRAPVARATLGLAGGALAVLALTGPARAALLRLRVVRLADLLLFAACVGVLGGEILLSGVARVSRSPLLARRDGSTAAYLDAFRLRPAQSGPGFPVNAAGHFDDEWSSLDPGEPLAVCIGDSFSTSIVPHAYHFTSVAERRLGRGAVANLGVAAAGPVEYLHLLRTEALALRPDVVVVDLFVGNDLDPAELAGQRTGGRLERWLSRDRLLLPAVIGRLAALAGEAGGGPARGAADEVAGEPTRGAAEEVAGDPSRGALGDAELLRLQPWLADPGLEPASFSEERFAHVERRRAQVACRPGGPADWPRLLELLLAMRDACGEVPFAVMLIPDEFQVEDDVWELVRAAQGGADLVRDLPQRILLPWLAEQGIPCLDLLPVLRAVDPLPSGRRHLYHRRDTHFNARGNAVAGEALAGFLRRWWP